MQSNWFLDRTLAFVLYPLPIIVQFNLKIYKKIELEDIIVSKKYYWKMNGYLYEVSEEQYKKYKKEYDRSKRLEKQRQEMIILSFDALDTDDCIGESVFADPNVDIESEVVDSIMHEKLNIALTQLSDEETFLIEQLYYLNKSERNLAEMLNLSQNAIHKRKHKILMRLKEILGKW